MILLDAPQVGIVKSPLLTPGFNSLMGCNEAWATKCFFLLFWMYDKQLSMKEAKRYLIFACLCLILYLNNHLWLVQESMETDTVFLQNQCLYLFYAANSIPSLYPVRKSFTVKRLASSPFKMQGSFPNQPAYYAGPQLEAGLYRSSIEAPEAFEAEYEAGNCWMGSC